MLKDIIGKDLSKMTLPVYFNDPLNLLQRLSAGFEYYDILERAAVDPDPVRRAAPQAGRRHSRIESDRSSE